MELLDLSADSIGEIDALCRRSLVDPPVKVDLDRALFGPGANARVIGDPGRAVVATVIRDGVGHIRLIAVDPSQRGKGLGRALVEAADNFLPDETPMVVGADAPDYLWPGVDTRETAAVCMFETMGYELSRVHYNMRVGLESLPEAARTVERPDAGERELIQRWLDTHWPNWTEESLRGFDRGDFLVARDSEGIAGFSTWNVNRQGWFGPTAVRPSLIGAGQGRPLLIQALKEMRRQGFEAAEIAWIGLHKFYSRTVGAVIHRTFWVLEKKRGSRPDQSLR
jgi:GNAT superfamily N-acetyltransferase